MFNSFVYKYYCFSHPDPKSKSIWNFHFYLSWTNKPLIKYLCYWWKYHISIHSLYWYHSKFRYHSNKSALLSCFAQGQQGNEWSQQPKLERENEFMERKILSVWDRVREDYLVAVIESGMEHLDMSNCRNS